MDMYTASGTKKIDTEQFVIEYTPLVKRIAYHMMARLPASVQVDDLIQAGMIGLLDAITRYEGSYGRQFESYAAQRIRGSILDELRDADWLSRGLRKKMRQIEAAVNLLEQRNGCVPSEQELAAIDHLPEREKQVMGMHYEQEMNLREIGEVLGVSESRVCQLHTQAIARLRSKLRNS